MLEKPQKQSKIAHTEEELQMFDRWGIYGDRNTRLTNSYNVHVPSHDSEILKRSFVYNGSVPWNSIRHEVKLADNVNAFKLMYKDMILFPSQLCS